MYQVLLTDNIAEEALGVFSRYPDIEPVRTPTLERNELLRVIPGYHAVIVRSPTKLTSEVIERGRMLKFIGRAGVGVDNIDVEEATRRGIVVMNSPAGNTVSTAEHTVGLILALARRVPQADRSVRSGEWKRSAFRGVELYGKTVGIVGLGRVGKEVARRLLAFSMKVLASDPFVEKEIASSLGVRLVDLDTLLRESHFVTLHTPLDASTRALISHSEIEKMRDGVFIVNCARGGIVEELALKKGLDSGKIAGIALDVYEVEPPDENPLFSRERSVFTPHIAAATREAQVRIAIEISETIAEALVNGVIRCAVNEVGEGQDPGPSSL